MDSIKKKLGRFVLPLCLGAAIISSIIYDYSPSKTVGLTVLSVLFEALVFLLLDRLYNMKHKKIGGAICFLTLAFAIYLMGELIRQGYMISRVPFNNWFYYPTSGVDQYLYALVFAGGYLFYAALFYFTQVRYRAMFTLLLVIFPFAVYAKRLDVMSSRYLAAILFFYLLVMVHNRQTAAESGIVVIPDNEYLTSIIVFAGVVVNLLFILPIPEVESVQEKDASVFNDLRLFDNETPMTAIADLSETSVRDHGIVPSGQELFYVNTSEDTLYLKTQSYSYFENDTWYYGTDKIEQADYVWTDPSETVPGMSIISKLDLLEEYCEYKEDEERLALIAEMRAQLETSSIIVAAQEGYDFRYLSIPEGTVSAGVGMYYAEFPANYGENVFTSNMPEGNIYCNGEWELKRSVLQYSAEYYGNDLIREFASRLGFTTADWDEIMNWYYGYGEDYQLYRNVNSDRSTAQLMDSGEYDEYDDRIRQLALEITKDCETDYEKAAAIESYFTNEGFVYDLEYMPDDESIEYFLFESKTGICSDFATAMTLMARSAGLTARYCEGFIAYENVGYEQVRNSLVAAGISLGMPPGGYNDHWFVVRDNYAHAFVEVYLPACGWVVFEPTVPSFTDIMLYTPVENNGINIIDIISEVRFYITLGVIAAAVIVLIVLYRPISEAVFRAYVTRIDRERALKKLYARMVKRLSRKTDTDLSAYTVGQACGYARGFGVDISILAAAFERSFYGGIKTSESDFAQAYEQYKQAYKVKIKPAETAVTASV